MTTEPLPCAHCDGPVHDAVVCASCAHKLRTLLEYLPANMAEIEITLTRQAKAGKGGARGVGHAFALPFAWASSDDAWAIGNTVLTWARLAREERYIEPDMLAGPFCEVRHAPYDVCAHASCRRLRIAIPRAQKWLKLTQIPITFDTLCAWLAGQVEWLRHQQFAQEAFDELLSIRATVLRSIDRRGWSYIGACSAIVQVLGIDWELSNNAEDTMISADVIERPCGTDLRLYDGAQVIRCPECGAEYDAVDQEYVVLLALRGHVATAAEISRVLTKAGRRISAERIRKWASRRQLQRTLGPADALYRISDVLDLMEASKTGRLATCDAPIAVGAGK